MKVSSEKLYEIVTIGKNGRLKWRVAAPDETSARAAFEYVSGGQEGAKIESVEHKCAVIISTPYNSEKE